MLANSYRYLSYLNLRLIIGVFYIMTISACQTKVNTELEVVKSLPTNPTNSPKPISITKNSEIPQAGDPRYTPVRDLSPSALYIPTGSLFNANHYTGLFLQKKSYNIGDMIQVILEEETRASKKQNLNKDKEGDVNLSPLELNAGSIKVTKGDVSLDHNQSSSFSSSSKTEQSNLLEGIINVFVSEILANGNLVVAGEKWIKLNEGDEYMRVFGEIRTTDILTNNTISSTKLGNSRIEYSGTGSLQNNQQYSVIGKILSIFE